MKKYNHEEHVKKQLEEWSLFLEELMLDMGEQNVGTEDLVENVVKNSIMINKILLLNNINIGSLLLAGIKLTFYLNYPELTFNNNYTLEMREVKVYDY